MNDPSRPYSECTTACIADQWCNSCPRRKKPVGRSVPAESANGYCDDDCTGYRQDPQPGHFWSVEEYEAETGRAAVSPKP